MPVNGIELKEGQIWKTKNYGVVKLSDSGVSANYPWRMRFPNSGESIGSITTDGKYWEEDEMPELLECIYNPEDKGEKEPMKFNPKSEPTKLFLPKPGDKIIRNNGEEFICCTKEFLNEGGLATYLSAKNKIFAYREAHDKCYHKYEWTYWDAEGKASYDDHNIMEVIPQSSEDSADKKEEVQEEPRYNAEQALYTANEIMEIIENVYKMPGTPWEFKDNLIKHLDRLGSKEYQEYLRLKVIYG